MQLISCHDGRLLTLEASSLQACRGRSFRTGLQAFDALAPGGAFACGAVHELLSKPSDGNPLLLAAILARSAAGEATGRGAIIWSDPAGELYPPALASHGIPFDRLYLLRPQSTDQTWAVAECLRCKGVSVVVAEIGPLTRIEARRLQLAAEAGGAAGILLRPAGKASGIYAAATRWLIAPAPGERTTQRWTVQLLHGHGGRLNHAVTLECSRENHLVRAVAQLADRPGEEEVRLRPRIAS